MAKLRPERSEALHTTHRSGAASPPIAMIAGQSRPSQGAYQGAPMRFMPRWHGSGSATGCGSARARRYQPWRATCCLPLKSLNAAGDLVRRCSQHRLPRKLLAMLPALGKAVGQRVLADASARLSHCCGP
jgi:hypothetical protein